MIQEYTYKSVTDRGLPLMMFGTRRTILRFKIYGDLKQDEFQNGHALLSLFLQ